MPAEMFWMSIPAVDDGCLDRSDNEEEGDKNLSARCKYL